MESYIYSIIQQEKICGMLKTFYHCMHLPIQLIDYNGTILESYGPTAAYCKIIKKHLKNGESCEKIHINASRQAIQLGETYIFSCHANLNHIVFPLVNQNTLFGSIIVGPFLMDEPDSSLVFDLDKRFDMDTRSLLNLYEATDSISIIPADTVTHISHLLYYLFDDLVAISKQQRVVNRAKLNQQSKINESIQRIKTENSGSSTAYPLDLEKDLITKVRTGNQKDAKAILNELLGYVFFSEGNSLDMLKARAISLCSLLSRAAIEGGATSDQIFRINNQFLKDQASIHTVDELCYQLQTTVETFTESVFKDIPSHNSELIKDAIHYINNHFSEALNLNNVANHVHLNPAYFSTTFKQATGSSFKEYLNMVRIEKSKLLLAATDYSIVQIASQVGFGDQSYFSKVFKKYTGLTPKQYR